MNRWCHEKHVGHNHDTAQELITWALNWGLPVTPHVPEHGV